MPLGVSALPAARSSLQRTTSGATDFAGVAVVASATPHTVVASWTELIASTPIDADALTFILTAASAVNGGNSSTLLDIGIGPAGSEGVIVTHLQIGYKPQYHAFTLPYALPAGTRIAARIRSVTASKSVSIAVDLVGGGLWRGPIGAALETYGADTASSRGTVLGALGANNTPGAWTQITAAALYDHDGLLWFLGAAGSTTVPTTRGIVEIGIGGSGSETVIQSGLLVVSSSAEELQQFQPAVYLPLRVPIRAGDRVAARYQAANSVLTLDLTLVGVRYG